MPMSGEPLPGLRPLIDVKHVNAADAAGGDTDQRCRIASEKSVRLVCGFDGIAKAVRRGGDFARMSREDRQPLAGEPGENVIHWTTP